MAEASFDDTAGWFRLGEIGNDESEFWKACGLQQNGGAPSAWKTKVDFYLHVYADSPALPRLGPGEVQEAEPFWLGLVPFAGISRLFVSNAKVARAVLARRAPERHPGLLPVPHRTLGFRLRLGEQGTYFDLAN
ncbi:hypothetical protein [Salinispora arenicola]|uniref:hypothetical protein n=1 Tax=Salinispora arenicola TaxID=168697 RepID=UPI00035F4A00|nr:hypothetical protein [Salinispora arenicola]